MINDATIDALEPLLDPGIDYTYNESECSSTDLSDATVHRMRCNYVTTAAVFVLVVMASELTRWGVVCGIMGLSLLALHFVLNCMLFSLDAGWLGTVRYCCDSLLIWFRCRFDMMFLSTFERISFQN